LISSKETREAPGWYADTPENFGVKLRYNLDDGSNADDIMLNEDSKSTPPMSSSPSSGRMLDMADTMMETSSAVSSIHTRASNSGMSLAPGGMGGRRGTGNGGKGPYPDHMIVPGVITVGMASISNLALSEDDLMGKGAEGGAADPIVIEELACKYLHSYSHESPLDTVQCESVTSDHPASPLKSLLYARYEGQSHKDLCEEDVLTTKVRCAVDACQWNSSVAAKIGLVGHASIWMALMTLVPAVVAVLHRKKKMEECEAAKVAAAVALAAAQATTENQQGGSNEIKSASLGVHSHGQGHVSHMATTQPLPEEITEAKEFDYNDHSPYGSLWQLMFAVDTTRDLLTELIDCGDCQHFVTCCEVFREIDGGGILDLLTAEIGNLRVREGYVAYLDMLNRLELFALANEYICKSKDSYISRLSQTGVIIRAGCASCGKEMNPDGGTTSTSASWCQKCKRCAGLCVFCQQPVRGLLHWCPVCGHGGHIGCTQKWFENHVMCPSGCGHKCIAHAHEMKHTSIG
jgi:hypothetical protein